jgi:glycosyltransferase involved in cell wall biosynthesis
MRPENTDLSTHSTKPKISFVTWPLTRRPIGIAAAIGASVYAPLRGRDAWPFVIRYLLQTVQTTAYLLRERPSDVIFSNPPLVTGVLLIILSRLLGFRVWADSHSGAFNDPRWARFARANAWVMRQCERVIVTNQSLASVVQCAGGKPLVLNWWVEEPVERRSEEGFLLAPFTYGFDEPVEELIAAARLAPHVKLVLTGRAPDELRRRAPANCVFTGWLTSEEYRERLRSARGLIALTTREDTMQLSAQEGLQHGLPMVMSGTRLLREFFSGGGVCFVDQHAPAVLADRLQTLWDKHVQLTEELLASRAEIYRRCRAEVDELRAALGVESHRTPERAVLARSAEPGPGAAGPISH